MAIGFPAGSVRVIDISTAADGGADSYSEVVALKATNNFTDENEIVCWPLLKLGTRTFHMSTQLAGLMASVDTENGGCPYESPSNKQIDVTGAVVGSGTSIDFDEVEANKLNAEGITTINFRGGVWVLWGPHNANFKDGTDIDSRDIFDAGIRMMMFLTNSFQNKYMSSVDTPLNRSKVDTILNDANVWLSGFVGDGKLLFAEIVFTETSNPVSSIVEGDFVFDVRTTTTPPGKSLTFKVQYTTEGLKALFGGAAQ
jgi:phage tail sheath protein FI